MKKNRKYLVIAGCMVAALLTGCTGKNAQDVSVSDGSGKTSYNTESVSGQPQNGSTSDNSSYSTNAADTADFNQLYEAANLNGKVTDFTDSGFFANQVVDDGDTAQIAVGGENAQDAVVTVQYTENTVFQRAAVSTVTESVSSLTDADKAEIKKESQVLVYGTYENSGVLKADKVIRLVWE